MPRAIRSIVTSFRNIGRAPSSGVAFNNFESAIPLQSLPSHTSETALRRRAASDMATGETVERGNLSSLFAQALLTEEEDRLKELKMVQLHANQQQMDKMSHHWNRTLQRLYGPNHYGVHLSYFSRFKYNRGSRGKWGLVYRSIGRTKYTKHGIDTI
mmetsp:Transcript_123143/g.195269  ORF Transcript_123143/g.195269 Transcript_123143/m.195269 type:complete len:157 (+) Transcript_123143:43-513(+)